MGFKRANGKLRSQMSLCDVASLRSDAIPGRYVCVECGVVLPNLMESWRKHGDILSNTSTLFCESCAIKLNASADLGLAPIQLSNFDKLNMGQFVSEFGVETPAQSATPQVQPSRFKRKVEAWKELLGT